MLGAVRPDSSNGAPVYGSDAGFKLRSLVAQHAWEGETFKLRSFRG